jgi:hypothetical protein
VRYLEIRTAMEALAPQVAQAKGLATHDHRE